MPPVLRCYRRFFPLLLSILAALFALTALKDRVMADQTHTFIIPADDGYGTQDCLGKDQACTEIIASAWCEAHGFSGPLAYGRSDDMTASIKGTPSPAKLDPNAFVVTCRD